MQSRAGGYHCAIYKKQIANGTNEQTETCCNCRFPLNKENSECFVCLALIVGPIETCFLCVLQKLRSHRNKRKNGATFFFLTFPHFQWCSFVTDVFFILQGKLVYAVFTYQCNSYTMTFTHCNIMCCSHLHTISNHSEGFQLFHSCHGS